MNGVLNSATNIVDLLDDENNWEEEHLVNILTNTKEGAKVLKALEDPEYLSALLCAAMCKDYEFDATDPRFADVTPRTLNAALCKAASNLDRLVEMACSEFEATVRREAGIVPSGSRYTDQVNDEDLVQEVPTFAEK